MIILARTRPPVLLYSSRNPTALHHDSINLGTDEHYARKLHEADNFREMNFLIARTAAFGLTSKERCKRKSGRVRRSVFSYGSQLAHREIFTLSMERIASRRN